MTSEERIRKELRYLKVLNKSIASASELRIGAIGAKAIPYMIELAKSRRADQRYRAAWSLGLIANRGAIDVLYKLASSRDSRISYDGALALSCIKDPKAARLIYRLLAENKQDQPACFDHQGFVAKAFIQRLLMHEEFEVRHQAIYSAARNRHARPLARQLLASDDEAIRAAAADALS